MTQDGRRCRLTSFFRIFVIIPIWIVLGTVSGGAWGWAGGHSIPAWPTGALARAGCCCLPAGALMLGTTSTCRRAADDCAACQATTDAASPGLHAGGDQDRAGR
jgi:hypothetical protein